MSALRPVFVAITSSTCGHCHIYRANQREKIVDHLWSKGKVDVVEIHTDTSNPESIGDQYHPNLRKHIGWFPIFFLFTGESWRDHDRPLVGEVLGGYIKDGSSYNVQENRPRHDFDGIVGWINNTLKTSKFNTSGGQARDPRIRKLPQEHAGRSRGFPKGARILAPSSSGRGAPRRGNMPRSGRVPPRNPNIQPEPSDLRWSQMRRSRTSRPKTSHQSQPPSVPVDKVPVSSIPGRSVPNILSKRIPVSQGNPKSMPVGPLTAPIPSNRGSKTVPRAGGVLPPQGPSTSLRLPPPPAASIPTNPGGNSGLLPSNIPSNLPSNLPRPVTMNESIFNAGNARHMFRPSVIPSGPH